MQSICVILKAIILFPSAIALFTSGAAAEPTKNITASDPKKQLMHENTCKSYLKPFVCSKMVRSVFDRNGLRHFARQGTQRRRVGHE